MKIPYMARYKHIISYWVDSNLIWCTIHDLSKLIFQLLMRLIIALHVCVLFARHQYSDIIIWQAITIDCDFIVILFYQLAIADNPDIHIKNLLYRRLHGFGTWLSYVKRWDKLIITTATCNTKEYFHWNPLEMHHVPEPDI